MPNQTLLLVESIFTSPNSDESKKTKFTIPNGVGSWMQQMPFDVLTSQDLAEILASEYLAIVGALKGMGISFRIIIAHRKNIDDKAVAAMFQFFGTRGLALDNDISETCFPKDMLVDFDGETHINPEANFNFPDNSGIISPLGEGGRVLKLGKKVFVPDPRGYLQTKENMHEP